MRILLLSLFILAVPGIIFAGPIVRSGDSISVEADQVLEGDFYGVGSKVNVSGTAQEDVYIVGGTVTINAPVEKDLTVVGGSVQVHSQVSDDLRVVAGSVTIAESVKGDVLVLGGVLRVLSTATIHGDLLFYGGDIEVKGTVGGAVMGTGETIRIDSSVGGDVVVTAMRSLTLGDRAELLGNLEYTSAADVVRAQGSVVVGNVQQKELSTNTEDDLYAMLLPLLISFFAALTLFLLGKRHIQAFIERTEHSFGVQGLVGLAVLIVLPLVSALLMASVLGMIVGVMLLLAYILLILGTWVLSGIVLGTFLLKPITKSAQATFLGTILGTFLLIALLAIPFIGPLFVLAVFVVVLGGVVTKVYEMAR